MHELAEMNQVIPMLRTLLHVQRLWATNKINPHGDLRGLETETSREDSSQYLVRSGQKKMEVNALQSLEEYQQHHKDGGEINAINKAEVVCHSCKKRGHYLRECRNKPVQKSRQELRCFNCDHNGHIARDCRQPRKSENENSDLNKLTAAVNGMVKEVSTMRTELSSLQERVKKAGF